MAGDRAGYWIALCLLGGCSGPVGGPDQAGADASTADDLAALADFAVTDDLVFIEGDALVWCEPLFWDMSMPDLTGVPNNNPPSCPASEPPEGTGCSPATLACFYGYRRCDCTGTFGWQCNPGGCPGTESPGAICYVALPCSYFGGLQVCYCHCGAFECFGDAPDLGH